MGKSQKPLHLLVHQSLADSYPWHELVAQGHVVVFMTPEERWYTFDLILGPSCWRMDETLLKYLDLAVKAARGVKYPKRVTK